MQLYAYAVVFHDLVSDRCMKSAPNTHILRCFDVIHELHVIIGEIEAFSRVSIAGTANDSHFKA